MSKRFKKITDILLLALIISVVVINVGYAQEAGAGGEDEVFGSVTAKAQEIFQNLKSVIFVLGGFGLIGFSIGAIFGKVQWKWFATLSFGLFIISVADQVVSYITEESDVHYAEGQSFEQAFGDGGLQNLDFGDTF